MPQKSREHKILTKSYRFIKEEIQLAHIYIIYNLFNLIVIKEL